MLRKMNVIRSHKHEIYSEEVNKVALSGDDDKRNVMEDRIRTMAYGHRTSCWFFNYFFILRNPRWRKNKMVDVFGKQKWRMTFVLFDF